MSEEAEVVFQSWEARVRVLTNPSVWFGIVMCFGVGTVFLAVLLTVVSRSLFGILIPAGLFVGLMVLFVVIGGVIDLFGGFRVTFYITSRGVRSVAGGGAKAASEAAVIGGLLAGNMTAVGAGALARSEQNVFIPYGDVTRVKASGWRRYVLVKGGWGEKPIGLSCTEGNFAPILRLLRARCPSARFSGSAA